MHLTLDLSKPTVVYEETSRECSNKGKQKYIPASPFVTLYPSWHLHVLFVVMVLLLMTVFFIILMVMWCGDIVCFFITRNNKAQRNMENEFRVKRVLCSALRQKMVSFQPQVFLINC